MTSHPSLVSSTAAPSPAASVLHWPEIFSFIGPLDAVGMHVHRAPALLLAMDRPIRLRVPGYDWQRVHGAWIPAGLAHELDCAGAPLAVVYFDPVRCNLREDGPTLRVADTRADWVRAGRTLAQRPAGGDAGNDAEAWLSLAECVLGSGRSRFSSAHARRDGFLLAALLSATDAPHASQQLWQLSLRQAADRVGLSPHRFSHRFSSELGMSWVAYRNWQRLMASTTASFGTSGSLTEVAMHHGYSTPSHFAACFRAHFGIRPSDLMRLRGAVVHARSLEDGYPSSVIGHPPPPESPVHLKSSGPRCATTPIPRRKRP